jgi:hypothetical protein
METCFCFPRTQKMGCVPVRIIPKNQDAYQYASLKLRCVPLRISQFFPFQHLAMYHPGPWLVSSFLQHASNI